MPDECKTIIIVMKVLQTCIYKSIQKLVFTNLHLQALGKIRDCADFKCIFLLAMSLRTRVTRSSDQS